MSDRQHLSVALNGSVSVGLAVVGVVASSLVSYALGPETKGVLGVLALLVSLAVTAGSLGLPDAVLVYFAGRGVPSQAYLVKMSVLTAGGAALVGVAAAVVTSIFVREAASPHAIAFTAICGGTTALWMLPNGALLGRSAFGPWNLIRLMGGLGWLVAIVGGVLVERSTGSESLSFGAIAATFGSLNIAVWIASLHLLSRLRRDANPPAAPSNRSLLRFGLPSSAAVTLMLLNGRVDQFFVAKHATSDVLGQYVAAAAYAALLLVAVQSLGNLAYPHVASLSVEHGTQLQRYGRVATSLGIYLAVPMWIMAPFLLPLLNGPDFPEAAGFARVLVIGCLFQSVTGVLEQGLKAIGRPREFLVAESLGLALTLLLVGLAASWGATWIAAASAVGSLATLVCVLVLLGRRTDTSVTSFVRIMTPMRAWKVLGQTSNN